MSALEQSRRKLWIDDFLAGKPVYIPKCVGFVNSEWHPGMYHVILAPCPAETVEEIMTAIDAGSYEDIYERIDNSEVQHPSDCP